MTRTKFTRWGAAGLATLLTAALHAPAASVVTFPQTTGDTVFAGRPIPGVGRPQMLFGIQPFPLPDGYEGTTVTLPGPFNRPEIDTGGTAGVHVLHFAMSLDDNPLPIETGSLRFINQPSNPDAFTARFNVGLGPTLFEVTLDLTAGGGVKLRRDDLRFPETFPGFPLGYQIRFGPAGGLVSGGAVQVAFDGQPLRWDGGGGRAADAPEPGTLGLLAAGGLALLGYRWQRRRRPD